MNTVALKPAAPSLKPNFSMRNVGVHTRNSVATKFAPTKPSRSRRADGWPSRNRKVSENFGGAPSAAAGAPSDPASPSSRAGSRRNAYKTTASTIPAPPKR